MMNRLIDRTFLLAAERLLRFLYRRFGFSPMRAVFLWMVICPVLQVVIGTALLSRFNAEDSIFGVTFTVTGLFLGVMSRSALRTIPSGYDANIYRLCRAIAAVRRESMLFPRLTFLFVAVSFLGLLAVSMLNGASADTLGHAGFAALFTCMALGEYSRSAEPPDPDEGDWHLQLRPTLG